MTDRTHLTLRVERDLHGGSIAGRVLDGGAADRSFSGCMGFAAAIEDALQAGAVSRYVVDHFFQEEQPRVGPPINSSAGGDWALRPQPLSL